MTEIEEVTEEMLKSLEESYHEFLADPTTPFTEDNPATRLGFYLAVLSVMREDPLPEEGDGLQEALEEAVVELVNNLLLIHDDLMNPN